MSTEQVKAWLADKANAPLLLDVRQPQEFKVSHLPGAINVSPNASVQDAANTVLKDVPKDRRIVAYCSIGVRSSILAQRLTEAGYTNVHNMIGSIFQWANEDRPLVGDNGPVKKVHPYNAHWGRLLEPERRADIPPVE